VLGIETSCDETAASVVCGGRTVLSNVVASQYELHAEYRGVVPEIASRAHAERIVPIVKEAIASAGVRMQELAAVAVGNRPGLIGSLLVGVSAAKALAFVLGRPIIGIDHVKAHLYAGLMSGQAPDDLAPLFPALGLVVSGGHTSIYLMNSSTQMQKVGSTIDDALGEAYDKVAAMLGLPFPGGPSVDALAATGDAKRFALPISRLDRDSLNMSFSGLKTAVLYTLRGVPGAKATIGGERHAKPAPELSPQDRADLCASFQAAAIAAVVLKLERARQLYPQTRSLFAGGGVTANGQLRSALSLWAERAGCSSFVPPMALCVDNGAMIAGLGHYTLAERGWVGDSLTLTAFPSGSVV